MSTGNERKNLYVALIAAGVFLLGGLLVYGDVFKPLERLILDYKFRNLQREDPNDKIALITIDEKSLSYFNRQNMYWPWPREFYQITTDYLKEAGADLIVYDILFDTPGFDRSTIDGIKSDERFARSMRDAGNVVIAFKSTPTDNAGDYSRIRYPDRFNYHIEGSTPDMQPHVLTSFPITKFTSDAEGLGNTVLRPDSDGIIRNLHLFDSLAHKGFIPSLAMSAYLSLRPDSTTIEWTGSGLRVGKLEVPLMQDGSYLINWYKKGGVREGTFPYYSFHQVVRSAVTRKRDSTADVSVPPSLFEDKIVMIGASAAGLGDIKSTPMSSLEPYPGMEIQATVLNNLIEGNFITQPPAWLTYAILLLLVFGVSFLIAYSRPMVGAFSIGGVLLAVAAAGFGLFYLDRIWFPTGTMFIMGAVSYSSSAAYKYFAEERQKKQIRSAFNQYIQPEFVEKLIANPELLKLGGEEKRLTVLFSDLAGFTSISESTPPEELITSLNDYLGVMTDIIFQHNGTLDKYIGDAIMAFWGAPIQQDNHAVLACRSALRIIEKIEEMKAAQSNPAAMDTHARFGINTGKMIVGNIGSNHRFNYTVLGDSVNLAARLEPANKSFGTKVMISENTYEQLTDDFYCRQLDLLVVKGKSEPVRVYELMADEQSGVDLNRLKAGLDLYRKGLDHYYNREWERAIEIFENVKHHFPGDGPSNTYIERCRQFRENPPDEDWDGVFQLKTK